jgi:hypothetical protein
VSNEVSPLLEAGAGALEAGDWGVARDSFRAALDQRETAEALLGLGEALWWLGEIHDSVAYRERAYVEFRRRPDPARAAGIALTLCVHYRANIGNAAASAGWLARATRLVEEFALEDVRGWLMLMQAEDAEDPDVGEKLAHQSRSFARQSGDLDLELCALAQIGSSLVKQGRVKEGLPYLDEAMAGSLAGEGGDFDTVVFTSCNMIGSCVECAEFERAVQWVRAADRFTKRYGCPFLYVYCRTLYGRVLVSTGNWSQAESELTTALRESRAALPPIHALASAALGELRLAQGRLEEAERLVAGLGDQLSAVPVIAAIHLARGEPTLAAAAIDRGLAVVGADRLERALLQELLGEAEIVQGQDRMAADRARKLAQLGADRACRAILARGERLLAHALAAGADAPAARRHLEAARAEFGRLQMPLEAGRTRLLLA